MIEPAIIIVRLLQYAGGAVVGGSSLFFLYAAPDFWPRRALIIWANVLFGAALFSIPLQAGLLEGSFSSGFTDEASGAIVAFLPLGKAALVRAAIALVVLFSLAIGDSQASRRMAALAGLAAAGSLAWMGHSGASETWVLTLSDLTHALCAAVWLGALAGLLWLTVQPVELAQLKTALERFSALGVPLVAALALTGAINAFYLVGVDNVRVLPGSPYGQLLLIKLTFFAAMLGLAALNRYRLTPGLSLPGGGSSRIMRSVAIEVGLGLGVIALVAWFGTLEPPASV